MKKLLFAVFGVLIIAACNTAEAQYDFAAQAAPAAQPTWTPPPPPKQPAPGQKCLINERTCEEVIKALRQPEKEKLLASWDIKITNQSFIRTGTTIYTLNDDVTIETPSTVPPINFYRVLLEDNTEFLFDQHAPDLDK